MSIVYKSDQEKRKMGLGGQITLLISALFVCAFSLGRVSAEEAALSSEPLSIVESNRGEVYAATEDAVYLYYKNNWQLVKGSEDIGGQIERIDWSPANHLTALTDSGVWERIGGEWSHVGRGQYPLSDYQVTSFDWAHDGSLYVAAIAPSSKDHQLWRYQAQTQKWLLFRSAPFEYSSNTAITTNFTVPGTSPAVQKTIYINKRTDGVPMISVSQSGVAAVLFGTHSLQQYQDGEWKMFPGTQWKPQLMVAGMNTEVYGSSEKGTVRNDGGAWRVLTGSPSRSIAVASDGTAVFGMDDGIWIYQKDKFKRMPNTPLDHKTVTAVYYSSSDVLYAGTESGLVYKFVHGKWTKLGDEFVKNNNIAAGSSENMGSVDLNSRKQANDLPSVKIFTDTAGHWAKDTIEWAVQQGIVDGYPDGTFQPNKSVTEAEFLAMLFKAFPDVELPAATDPQAPWHQKYYTIAENWGWPLIHEDTFNRGNVARILAASQGNLLSTDEAVQYLLDHKLANGKTSNTVEGFAAGDQLTRAEALMLIKNVLDENLRIGSGGSQ